MLRKRSHIVSAHTRLQWEVRTYHGGEKYPTCGFCVYSADGKFIAGAMTKEDAEHVVASVNGIAEFEAITAELADATRKIVGLNRELRRHRSQWTGPDRINGATLGRVIGSDTP